jgi:hypothetical protein
MDERTRTQFLEGKQFCETVLKRYHSIPSCDTISGHDEIAKVHRFNYLRVTTIMARVSFIEAIVGSGDFPDALRSWDIRKRENIETNIKKSLKLPANSMISSSC